MAISGCRIVGWFMASGLDAGRQENMAKLIETERLKKLVGEIKAGPANCTQLLDAPLPVEFMDSSNDLIHCVVKQHKTTLFELVEDCQANRSSRLPNEFSAGGGPKLRNISVPDRSSLLSGPVDKL